MTNGLLSVTSQNSTLGDIMTAIRRQTGAAIELPPGAAQERVAAHIGPAAPKDVVAALLNGSRFDYIILGSMKRPGMIDRIILTQRQNQAAGGQTQVAQNPQVQGRPQSPPAAQPNPDAESEEDNAPERDAAEENAETPDQEQPDQTQPQQQPGQQQNQPYQQTPAPQAQPDQSGQQQNQQNPRIKTPEELLRELQQMRNQQNNPQQTPPPDQAPQNEPPQ